MSRLSVATIDSPEFVNITSVSPLISKCEVKVLYVGQNRNHSYITKEVATEMAQTLPGCPIVGYYVENKEDFADHGEQVVIDHEGVKYKRLTKPYGFVAPDSKIWFQKFEDTDDFGNTEVREYLMTEGYLWTEQYAECKRVLAEGNPQSMELDEKTLQGHWSKDNKTGVDFFIINDAIFSKLCILGEDVEPCFEGASVTAPEVSSTFSKNDDMSKTLFTMMKELKDILSNQEGGQSIMENNEFSVDSQDKTLETSGTEFQNNTEEFAKASDEEKKPEDAKASDNADSNAESSDEKKDDEKKKEFSAEEDKSEDFAKAEDENKDFAAKEDEEEYAKKDDSEDEAKAEESKEEAPAEDEKKKDYSAEYAALSEEHEKLKTEFAALKESYDSLVEFKQAIDNEKKDNLIEQFYMLSDEDKKDVIDNKANYSLDEIESKLSVICVRKKVNFAMDTEPEVQEPITYNLNNTEASNLPDWVKAVQETKKKMQ